MKQDEIVLDAPVAGMSLTAELGARPWQKPSQYNTVDEAVEYYLTRLSSDSAMSQIADILESGVSVTKLANIIQLGSVMEGIHTIDVGVLTAPVIIEFIQLIGDRNDVDYETGLDELDQSTTKALQEKAIREFKKEISQQDSSEKEKDSVVIDEPLPEPSGLMSRRM
jgi:hypothetical protein|tara:strand:- start:3433 stop:3933 length:501 start_codon:yes stop_codon:yes gene_type:complete